MKNLLKISFFGLAITVMSSTFVEASMLIDDFEDLQLAPSVDAPVTFDEFTGSPTGLRDLNVISGAGSLSIDNPAGAPFSGAENQLFFLTSGAGVNEFELLYDGFSTALDLSSGNTGFIIGGVTGNSLISLTLAIEDTDGDISSFSSDFTGTGTPTDLFIGFSQLSVDTIIDGLDLSSIASITLTGEMSGAFANFQANSLSVGTPEPSSLILCGFGLAAAGAYSYRRRRQAVKVNA